MSSDAPVWKLPTRTQAAAFWWRTRAHIWLHSLRGVWPSRPCLWHAGKTLGSAPLVAELRSPLWPLEPDGEFMLTAGKVHNLRLAAQAFNGVEIPAGQTLSFWRQLGRPARSRGFVLGREVRAGCVIPTIAGGICQLSNALATCAQKAGFELVERHAHTARANPGDSDSLDATVFWNYVDLRIRAPVAWRIELELTATEMVLAIRAAQVTAAPPPLPDERVSSKATQIRNCLGCNETRCFRHRSDADQQRARSAWLLDDEVPEFERWLQTQDRPAVRMRSITPRASLGRLPGRRPIKTTFAQQGQPGLEGRDSPRLCWIGLRRAVWLRLHARRSGKRQASVLDGQGWLAAAYARRLRPEHTHLVIDQGLLPHLQQQNVLGGRTYDVLVRALPMEEIQRRLDQASASTDRSGATRVSLSDFRAPEVLVQAELTAIRGARRLITAHTEVAAYWSKRVHGLVVHLLPWSMPEPATKRYSGRTPLVVFPASALARKGACELAEALQGLSCRLRVLGSAADDPAVWGGIALERGNYRDDWLSQATVVVLPAHIEHAPRALLQAVSTGVPVIATPACGISNLDGVHLVPAGDATALRALLQRLLWGDTVISADNRIHQQDSAP